MVVSEGLLGRGYWEVVKEKQDQYAAPSKDIGALSSVRPYVLSESAQSRLPLGNLRSTAWLDGLRGFAALLVSAKTLQSSIPLTKSIGLLGSS
ncbi:hypothetical protein ES702_00218 [subsurface metagenome]